MSDERWMTPEQRSRMEHAIHRHPKREEVFDRARELGTIHEDTRQTAKLLNHAEAADELIAELAEALRELHAMVWGECPWLLSELTGGNANVDMQIIDVLARVDSLTKDTA